MTVAQFKTNCDNLIAAIEAGDVTAANVKANTNSCKNSAIDCAIHLADLVNRAGLGAKYQSTLRDGDEVNN